MKDNSTDKSKVSTTQKGKKNRFLIGFVCIFAAVVLIITAIFGTIALVKRNRAVARYGSNMIDGGTAAYLASVYKYEFLSGLGNSGIDAYDTEWFWESRSEGGATYGELLRSSFKEYLSGILVANALFDRYSKLERADKDIIEEMKERALTGYGSEENFNKEAEKYGFTYKDYGNAVRLIYKATRAQTIIFGESGEKLESFPAECTDYYNENYSRVSLLFLRDEEILEKDENGRYVLRPITDWEREERLGYAEELRAAIYNRENGLDGKRITPEMFETYYKKSDSDMEMYRGYYLAKNGEATAELATQFPEAVDKAMSMKTGEYAEVECSIGICFIYKEALDERAYTDKDNPFFSDFYSDAIYSVYSDMLATYAPDVEFTDRFSDIDVVSAPKNYQFVISVIR